VSKAIQQLNATAFDDPFKGPNVSLLYISGKKLKAKAIEGRKFKGKSKKGN